MRTTAPRFISLALALVVAACGDNRPTTPTGAAPKIGDSVATANTGSGLWRDSVIGTGAGAAQYAMFRPRTWNGDVVFYAHGFVAPQLPVALPTDDIAPLRDALGQMGFAVAYSSYSENGFATEDGVQRTHELRGLFTSRYGKPKHAYLMGHSLGGQIIQEIAETWGNEYDGALSLCGLVGGSKMETQYIAQVRDMFDFFYPGALPGNVMGMPPITDANAQVAGPAVAAIQEDASGFGALARIDQTAVAGRDVNEQVTTVARVLALHALEVNDLLARTHGHVFFDNSNVEYTSAALPPDLLQAVNGGIARFTATQDALEWLDNNYQPTGRLRIPMLTVHKKQDWLVPFYEEAAYRAIVARQGNAQFLVQRSVDDYGHCEFTGETTLGAFGDLVRWVTTGVAPTP